MISIVDYGMGNLRSAQKALEHLGFESALVSTAEEVARAGRLVLPGVGAFGDAMKGLRAKGLVEPLRERAAAGKSVFGICLGMQLLFEESEEDQGVEGLGIFKGGVRRFRLSDPAMKVPHMGWNSLKVAQAGSRLMAGLGEGATGEASGGAAAGSEPRREPGQEAFVYFVHSYYVDPADKSVTAATCDYGGEFTAVVELGEVGGTQFHPEKSQATGLRILENFARGGNA